MEVGISRNVATPEIPNKKLVISEAQIFTGINFTVETKYSRHSEEMDVDGIARFKGKHGLPDLTNKQVAREAVNYFNRTANKGEAKRKLISVHEKYITNIYKKI